MTEFELPLSALSLSAQHFGAEIQAAQLNGDSRAGALAALCFHAAGLGHSCLQLSRIADLFPEYRVAIPAAELHTIFSGNALARPLSSAQQPTEASLLVVFGERLYLKKFWRMELELIHLVHARLDQQRLPESGDVTRDLANLCQHKRLVFLTGGPGTGKTTAMSSALALWLEWFEIKFKRPACVALCAPTGKAAARMSTVWLQQIPTLNANLSDAQISALPEQANTLHRVLGFAGVGQNEAKLKLDLMVVDEASMIDLPMMRRLLGALPEAAHLLLIGDPQQLPSIEIGNVLGALLALESNTPFGAGIQAAHLQLHFNHRQVASPGLAALAEAIQFSSPENTISKLTLGEYQQVTYHQGPLSTLNTVLDAHADFHRQLGRLATPEVALAALQQQIVLTPLRQGPMGCEQLNAHIARRAGHHSNRHGQAVLITENVPALSLSNGDVGLLWHDGRQLFAYFNSRVGLGALPIAQLPAHELAYVLTIHKAQGSEFEQVDLILPETPHALVSKALLYTAITRAKARLSITGPHLVLLAGLNHDIRRMNGLNAMAIFNETENTINYSGSTD